jgi:stage V sporulation protein R
MSTTIESSESTPASDAASAGNRGDTGAIEGSSPSLVLGNDRDHSLPPEIRELVEKIHGYAVDYGLDFFPTIFEMLDYDEINQVAARGGFPTRYPHWRFGMGYQELSKGYSYGLQKIYEMVINNNPCYAYLLKCNMLADQKLVIGHVYAHCDFFKNNFWFQHTNCKMLD